MRITNIHEAKTNLSKLIEAVLGGEDVIIAKAGKPPIRMIAGSRKL
ncbi:MAG: type II toxin-antitoxin system prevent-host-death family antitoxin [Cyanobacteria bacterium P01_D01_bin.50]